MKPTDLPDAPANEPPWLIGDLAIASDVLRDVDAHAVEQYPGESCGMLLGPASDPPGVDQCIRQINQADRYHRADPETFPRTARTFYVIDAKAVYTTFERGMHDGRPVKVVYHSHCDVGAYFSAEDQAAAAPDGVRSYPVLYLVTSVRNRVVDDHRLFTFHGGAWIEVTYRVV